MVQNINCSDRGDSHGRFLRLFPDLRLQASNTCECNLGKRPVETPSAKGKRQTSDSRREILKNLRIRNSQNSQNLQKWRACSQAMVIIDLFADTAAISNYLDLGSIMGCPGGYEHDPVYLHQYLRALFGPIFL